MSGASTTAPTDLSGACAIVTGAAGGIGGVLSSALAAHGATVHGLDVATRGASERSVEGAEHAAAPLGEGRVIETRCDVTDEAAVDAALGAAVRERSSIDIVVTAAGRFPNRPLEEWSLSQFEDLWRLNVGGVFNVVRSALPYLRRSTSGRVVIVSSSAVHQAVPGFAPYAATKAALIGFARSMAAELAPDGVTVNVVTPGLTGTAAALSGDVAGFFTPVIAGQLFHRRMEPADLVGGVLFLCSQGASMVTGQVLNIDAGAVTY